MVAAKAAAKAQRELRGRGRCWAMVVAKAVESVVMVLVCCLLSNEKSERRQYRFLLPSLVLLWKVSFRISLVLKY